MPSERSQSPKDKYRGMPGQEAPEVKFRRREGVGGRGETVQAARGWGVSRGVRV